MPPLINRFRGSMTLRSVTDFANFVPSFFFNQVIFCFESNLAEPFRENLVLSLNYAFVDQIVSQKWSLSKIPRGFSLLLKQGESHIYQKRLVTVELTGGLGNRLFQLCATHWYAEQYNYTAVIAEDKVQTCQHSTNNYALTIFRHFPIVASFSTSFDTFQEKEDQFSTFVKWPETDRDVLLRGYFQSIGYVLPGFRSFLCLPHVVPSNHTFLHIRRGDFVNNSFHYLNLRGYYMEAIRRKFSQVQWDTSKSESDKKVSNVNGLVICSDDLVWCKKQWFLNTDISLFNLFESELDTLALMSACQNGGICGNSTFSWWGAWLSGGQSFLPFPWLNNSWKLELYNEDRMQKLDITSWFIPINYINLHHRLDRRHQIEKELFDILDVPISHVKRFEAVHVPKRGHLGCASSHVQLLQHFLLVDKHLPFLAVVEDDFEAISSVEALLGFLKAEDLESFDGVLFGGGDPQQEEIKTPPITAKFANKLTASQETVGYIVTRQGAKKLLTLWQKDMIYLANPQENQHPHCIDQSWHKLHREGAWYILKPLLCKQRVSYSDIEKRTK